MGCTTKSINIKDDSQPLNFKSSNKKHRFEKKFGNSAFKSNSREVSVKTQLATTYFEKCCIDLIELTNLNSEQIIFKAEYLFKLHKIASKINEEQLLKFPALAKLKDQNQLIDYRLFHSFFECVCKESDLKFLSSDIIEAVFNEISRRNPELTCNNLLQFYKSMTQNLVEIIYEELKKRYLIYGGLIPICLLEMNLPTLTTFLEKFEAQKRAKISFFDDLTNELVLETAEDILNFMTKSIYLAFGIETISGVESIFEFHIYPKLKKNEIQKITTKAINEYLLHIADELYSDALKQKERLVHTKLIEQKNERNER